MTDNEPVSVSVYSPYFRENSLEYPGLYFIRKDYEKFVSIRENNT